MKKKSIIIIVVVLLVAVAAGVYIFVIAKPADKIYGYYSPGDYFVTNVKDNTSLIKTTIVLELYAYESEMDDITTYMTENNHIIRDIIVFTLRSKTEAELRAQDVDKTLRQEIVQRLKDDMGIDYIETVYFNDYVVQ
jgi:flagellar FliL protein